MFAYINHGVAFLRNRPPRSNNLSKILVFFRISTWWSSLRTTNLIIAIMLKAVIYLEDVSAYIIKCFLINHREKKSLNNQRLLNSPFYCWFVDVFFLHFIWGVRIKDEIKFCLMDNMYSVRLNQKLKIWNILLLR